MTKATQTIDLQGFLRDPNDRALGTSRLISTICFRSPKEAPVDGIPPTSAEGSDFAQEGPAELIFPPKIFIGLIYCKYGAHEHLGGAFATFGSQDVVLC